MDNTPAPIPSISPLPAVEPEVSTPVESQSRRWLLWSAIGLTFLTLGIALGLFTAKFIKQTPAQSSVSSYEDCLAAKGSIVQESYPATCVTTSGQRFVQPLTDEEKQNLQPPDLYREPDGSAATADWKTYTNTKYSYSLKYEVNPELKQLSCSSQKMESGEDVFILDENNSTFPECGFGGYSWPISITAQDSIQDCNSTESWQSTKSEIKISGIGATKCIQKFIGQKLYPGPDEITWVGSKHNSKFFVFNLSNPKYQDSFDQILSTFKFLDQNE